MIKWLYLGAWNERRIYVWKKRRQVSRNEP